MFDQVRSEGKGRAVEQSAHFSYTNGVCCYSWRGMVHTLSQIDKFMSYVGGAQQTRQSSVYGC